MKRFPMFAVLLFLVAGWASCVHAADASQVLVWTPYVRLSPELENVRKILGGNLYETRTTSPSELQGLLVGKCVLIIPEQQEKGESDLEDLGRTMAGVLKPFLERGGTIIGMTYSKGAEDVLRGAGIWAVNDDYNMTGDSVSVAAADHPLAVGVAAKFVAPDGATDFSGLPTGAVVIVDDPRDGAPVVFQWQSGQGTVVMLGFDYYSYNDSTAALLQNAVKVACGTVVGPACPPCPPCTTQGTGVQVWSALTTAEIERLLGELGYTFQRKADSTGDPMWTFTVEGTKVMLFVYSQTATGSGAYRSIQLAAAWSVTPKPSCTHINQWNADHRGSTAWLDSDGDPVLEANLYLRGGVSWENLKEFFRLWAVSLSAFKEHLGKK